MSNEEVEFKYENGIIEAKTVENMTEDVFCEKIAGVMIQIHRFDIQKKATLDKIERDQKMIGLIEESMERAAEDVRKSKQFLAKNHKEDLIVKIEKMVDAEMNKDPMLKQRITENQ